MKIDNSVLIEQTKDYFENWESILKKDVHFYLPPYSVHTYKHCRNVLKFGLMIGANEGLNDSQMNALACACIFHDCGRKDDFIDPTHGEVSANKYKVYCLTHGIDFDMRVYLAIYYHNLDDSKGYKAFRENSFTDDVCIYRILKDADALDRYRLFFGKGEPSVNLLRTETAKDEAMLAYAYVLNQF